MVDLTPQDLGIACSSKIVKGKLDEEVTNLAFKESLLQRKMGVYGKGQ